MKYRPSRRGDLYAWGTYNIDPIDGCRTVQDETCNAVRRNCACSPARPETGRENGRRARAKRCVQCSLPSVVMVDIVSARVFPARKTRELTVETISAKEAKNRVACSGKHLGCS